MNKKVNWLNVFGTLTTVAMFGLTVVQGVISYKQMQEEVKTEIHEALAIKSES